MLVEYVLNPDVFDDACYNPSQLCSAYQSFLIEPFLNEALVRDLRLGEWYKFLIKKMPQLQPAARKFLEMLKKEKRLCPAKPALTNVPIAYEDWCNEALASHNMNPRYPLDGIITSDGVKSKFANQSLVASIQNLSNTIWWQQKRSPSIRLYRQTSDYLKNLRLILSHANSLLFIDPYIDPTRANYQEFYKFLPSANDRVIPPLVEIHRKCYEGSGPTKIYISAFDWEQRFGGQFEQHLIQLGLTADIFIWDDFHDRYLITDLIGITIPYGFDIAMHSNSLTTWERLGIVDKDDIQREFEENTSPHVLKYKFTVGI